MRLAISAQDLRLDLNSKVIEWVRAEISKTYPFGSRENYPYQVWLQELSAYIESWKPKESWYTGEIKAAKTWNRREIKPIPVVEGQLNLFDSPREDTQ